MVVPLFTSGAACIRASRQQINEFSYNLSGNINLSGNL